MAPRKPAKNATGLDAETAALLRQSGKKAAARQAGNVEHNDEVRDEYAARTNADVHDDHGVAGVNRGENWTNLSLPNPGEDED